MTLHFESIFTDGFTVGNLVVAEAWIHATKPGWWLRIRDTSQTDI